MRDFAYCGAHFMEPLRAISSSIQFRKEFSVKALNETYHSFVRYKSAVGVDKINTVLFEKNFKANIDIIHRKVFKGTYKFSQYREKLLLRGQKKFPRTLAIPTMRDKLTLKALSNVLSGVYGADSPFLHEIIEDIKNNYMSGQFDTYLRLDVKDFYPSIKHDLLLKELGKKIRKKEIISLIRDAIRQATVAKAEGKKKTYNEIGVPQGLSISNISANIYMMSLDERHKKETSYKFYRYVDDLLVLCNSKDAESIKEKIVQDCKALGLSLHADEGNGDKSGLGNISDGFTYLGYIFSPRAVSVRKSSLDHLRESIVKIFTNYKYSDSKNLQLLKWAVDIRITGCVFNGLRFGWLFFFSQIDDISLLFSLDHFVNKLSNRFDIDTNRIKPKRFVKAFHEITKNKDNTSYIPNFDSQNISEKRRILTDIFDVKTKLMTPNEIEYQFNKKIYRTVRDLERDLARNS